VTRDPSSDSGRDPAPLPGASAPGRASTAADALIRLSALEKSVPQGAARYYLLRNVALSIAPGEFVSIMGPSGAGKSTLLAILGMHDHDWSGEYVFDGEPVHRMNPKARGELRNKNIGFVFQSYHLIDDLTVFENLEVPLSYRNVPKPRLASIVCDALDRFQIVAKRDLYPRQLSGGQQQLVAIARALVASPRLILADEPTGNLHSEQGREIMELFRSLNAEGVTIVQVTHSDVNAGYGQRVVRLKDGWVEGETRIAATPAGPRGAAS
jgi:ABC-type lipoprotein export system ATPase subunit